MLNTTLMPTPAATRFKSMSINIHLRDPATRNEDILPTLENKFQTSYVKVGITKNKDKKRWGFVTLNVLSPASRDKKQLTCKLPKSSCLEMEIDTLIDKIKTKGFKYENLLPILSDSLSEDPKERVSRLNQGKLTELKMETAITLANMLKEFVKQQEATTPLDVINRVGKAGGSGAPVFWLKVKNSDQQLTTEQPAKPKKTKPSKKLL